MGLTRQDSYRLEIIGLEDGKSLEISFVMKLLIGFVLFSFRNCLISVTLSLLSPLTL